MSWHTYMDCPDTRSLVSIIWSCFAAIFTCTWVAIHYNIPSPTDTFWTISFRRTGLMLSALIAPELVLFWAMRQRVAAKQLGVKYAKYGWGTTHGFWLQMGGFYLCKMATTSENTMEGKEAMLDADQDDSNVPPELEFVRVLSPETFHELLSTKHISFPRISLSEIEDKSKGDGLVKGIIVLQTTWFIVQCIARGVQRLPMTQLEIATVAFAMFNGFIYYVWWEKPLEPGCGLGIILEKNEDYNEKIVLTDTRCSEKDVETQEIPRASLTPSNTQAEHQNQSTSDGHFLPTAVSRPISIDSEENISTPSPRVPLQARIQSYFQSLGWIGRVLGFILFLPIQLIVSLTQMMLQDKIEPSASRVPTFYAFYNSDTEEYADKYLTNTFFCLFMATAFGGIHLIAFDFTFRTEVEKLLWKVAAIAITAVPLGLLTFVSLLTPLISKEPWYSRMLPIYVTGVVFGMVAYSVSRVMLIVLVMVELGKLKGAVFQEINWTKFIPHF